MPAPNAPRFLYPSTGGTTLNMLLPARLGESSRDYVGGATVSGAGVPEVYVIRKEGLYAVTLVVDETQQAALQAMVDWSVDHGSLGIIRFYPDQNIVGTFHDCWLIEPGAGKKLEFKKIGTYPRAFEVQLLLKRVDLAGFNRVLP